nr:hypothetical protein GCM10020092_022740 [Actinoplanes digitatis]
MFLNPTGSGFGTPPGRTWPLASTPGSQARTATARASRPTGLRAHSVIQALNSVFVTSSSSSPQGLVSLSWAVVYRAEKCACSVCGLVPVYGRAVQPHDRDQMRRL